MPYVFTEQGVAMLSSVLNSKCAVQVNIEIMRTFVCLRQMLLSNTELSRRLDELEKKYDTQTIGATIPMKEITKEILESIVPERIFWRGEDLYTEGLYRI